MTRLKHIRIAFDNAGGVTIIAPTYAHSYSDGVQPAEDVMTLLDGGNINLWDGNDKELLAVLDDNEIARYERVYDLAEVDELFKSGKVEIDEDDVYVRDGRLNSRLSGHSESQFFRSMAVLRAGNTRVES